MVGAESFNIKLANKVYAVAIIVSSVVSILFSTYNVLVALIIGLLVSIAVVSRIRFEYLSEYIVIALLSSIIVIVPHLSFLGDVSVLVVYLALFTLLVFSLSILLESSNIRLGFLGPTLIYIIILHVILYVTYASFVEEYLILPISSSIMLVLLIVYVFVSLTKLKISFTSQITLYKGMRRNFEIEFYNKGFIKVRVVVLRLSIQSPIVKVYPRLNEVVVSPNESSKLSILVNATSIGNVDVKVYLLLKDMLGLLVLTRGLDLNIRVLPRSTMIYEGIRRALKGVLGEVGATGRGLVSLGQLVIKKLAEFYGAREYVPGDPPSLIYWKKSLKHHRLIVKDLRGAGGAEIVIIVDLASSSIDELDDLVYKLLSILLYLSATRHLAQVYVSVRINGKPIYEPRREEDVSTALINLYNILSKIDYEKVRSIKGIIDSPQLGYIDKGLSEDSQTLMGTIVRRLIAKYKSIKLNDLLVDILKITRGSKPMVILLTGNVIIKHVYAVLKYMLVLKGYEVREI